MEILGKKKIGDHFYNFSGTASTYSKAQKEKDKLQKKGLVVELRDQKKKGGNLWIIWTRPDQRFKKKPKSGKKSSNKPKKCVKGK